MIRFEVLERDGLARRGQFDTPHGRIATPALLPVVHPDPARQPVAPTELRERFGLGAVITSAYITWRTPPLRAVAEASGIHGLLRFDGPVMTDSGAFQQHAYGSVEVGPAEIVEFQQAIGSDIATVLDVFTEPETGHDDAERALRETERRAAAARASRAGLLAVPVQGGAHPDLRARSARAASGAADVLAFGGVVPLLEQYRFRELAEVLVAARPDLASALPLHLFGAGHPMTFALAALVGVDLVDSSAYLKFARRGKLLFPDGTRELTEIREPICRCRLCAERPLPEVARLAAPERERHLAAHNLLVSAEEMATVRQAIRDGTLWELVERRATAHPALRAGLDVLLAHPEIFLPTEPEARRAFRETGPTSRLRPAAVRFSRRAAAYRERHGDARTLPRIALTPEYLGRLPAEDRSGRRLEWSTDSPLGPVPLELSDVYPVGPYLGLEEFAVPRARWPPRELSELLRRAADPELDLDRDWTPAWDARQRTAALEWTYGPTVAAAFDGRAETERSRRTGRVRRIRDATGPLFVIGSDAVARPTFRGAAALRELLPGDTGRVVVRDDAAPFVRAGRTLFAGFVERADARLVPGASALLVDRSDTLLAVGRLVLAPHEMAGARRGVVAHVVAHARSDPPDEEPPEPEADARGPGDPEP